MKFIEVKEVNTSNPYDNINYKQNGVFLNNADNCYYSHLNGIVLYLFMKTDLEIGMEINEIKEESKGISEEFALRMLEIGIKASK